jgi:hypothetical protein
MLYCADSQHHTRWIHCDLVLRDTSLPSVCASALQLGTVALSDPARATLRKAGFDPATIHLPALRPSLPRCDGILGKVAFKVIGRRWEWAIVTAAVRLADSDVDSNDMMRSPAMNAGEPMDSNDMRSPAMTTRCQSSRRRLEGQLE